MQDTCERLIPKIVCTKANFTDSCVVLHHEDEILCEKRLLTRQRRIGRPRVRRNSRRLSITQDRHSSSSSRSPSPSPNTHQTRLTSDIPVSQTRFNCDFINDKFEGHLLVDNINSSINNTTSGYGQYLQLLQVPQSSFTSSSTTSLIEWGEPSGDDLSSEWESDHSDSRTLPTDNVDITTKVVLHRCWTIHSVLSAFMFGSNNKTKLFSIFFFTKTTIKNIYDRWIKIKPSSGEEENSKKSRVLWIPSRSVTS